MDFNSLKETLAGGKLKIVDSSLLDMSRIADSDIGAILTDAAGGATTFIARFRATHSARKTLNETMYLPDAVSGAIGTWTSDYNKPLLKDHCPYADNTIGRIVSAVYVDTAPNSATNSRMTFSSDYKANVKAVQRILALQSADRSWGGYGYDLITTEILDKDVISRLKDKRYITGSSGKMAHAAFCSVCGQDWFKDGVCDHFPGKTYEVDVTEDTKETRQAFIVIPAYDNEEYSITPTPADTQSGVEELVEQAEVNDSFDYYVYNKDEHTVISTKGMRFTDDFSAPELKPLKTPEIITKKLPDFFVSATEDWSDNYKEILIDRTADKTEEEAKPIFDEVVEQIQADFVNTLKYEAIASVLTDMQKEVETSGTLDSEEVPEENRPIVISGIKNSIMAQSERQRSGKSICFLGSREIPIKDKYHAIAVRKIISDAQIPMSVKDTLFTELVTREKTIGVDITTKKPEFGSFDDYAATLEPKLKQLVENHINEKINESVASVTSQLAATHTAETAGLNTKITELTDRAVQLEEAKNTELATLTATLDTTKAESVQWKKQFDAASKMVYTKTEQMVTHLVESILDIMLVDNQALDVETTRQTLMTKSCLSLTAMLEEKRTKFRTSFIKTEDAGAAVSLTDMTPEEIRFFAQALPRFDKTNTKKQSK